MAVGKRKTNDRGAASVAPAVPALPLTSDEASQRLSAVVAVWSAGYAADHDGCAPAPDVLDRATHKIVDELAAKDALATPSQDMVVAPVHGTYLVKHALSPSDRLARPVNARGWKAGTTLVAKVSQAGSGGAADVWDFLFHSESCPRDGAGDVVCTHHDATCPTVDGKVACDEHTHVGQKPPTWLIGRLGATMRRIANIALQGAVNKDFTAEWLVRAATNAPLYAMTFETAWWEACGVPVAPRTLAAATFDALDLVAGGVGWPKVEAAIKEAAFAGNSKVSRAYEDQVAASRRQASSARRGSATQGQVLQGAYARALAKQAELDRQKGAA